jgi:hypothetical protein
MAMRRALCIWLVNWHTIALQRTRPFCPGDQIGSPIGRHRRIDDAENRISVIEEGDRDRTPAEAAQKVSGAVVRVNYPARTLLLGRRVRWAGHDAEFFAHKSCGPSG